MKNTVFSVSRFMNVLRKEIAVNGKSMLLMSLGLYLGLVVIMVLGNLIFHGFQEPESVVPHFVMYVIFGLLLSVMASLSFNGLKSKGGRVDLLMMPATALEKLLVQALVYFVGTVVVFFACAQLADFTRIGAMNLLAPTFEIPGPINFFNMTGMFAAYSKPDDLSTAFSVLLTMGLLTSSAIYFLGAVLCPRYTWVKIMVLRQIAQTLLVAVIVICMREKTSYFIANNGGMWIMTALSMLEVVVCWVLSYVFFKRKDVITRSVI